MSKVSLGILAAVVVFLLGGWLGCTTVRQEAREQHVADSIQIAQYRQTVAVLRQQAARTDTLYRTDTLRLRAWLTRWDTTRVLERFTDTLVSVDTVVRIVRDADSTIQACTTALGTCEDRLGIAFERALLDSLTIRALSRQLAGARLRNRFGCTLGAAVTTQGVKPGGSCGIRIF